MNLENLGIDYELLEACKAKIGKEEEYKNDKIETVNCVDESKMSKEERKHFKRIGDEIISKGKYAVVTTAGGQRNKTWI